MRLKEKNEAVCFNKLENSTLVAEKEDLVKAVLQDNEVVQGGGGRGCRLGGQS